MNTASFTDCPPLWPHGPIPAGTYTASIASAYLDNFSENLILALTWMVKKGKYRGCQVFDWLLLSGEADTVQFGYGKFLAIARAIGHPDPENARNAEELLDRPCLIQVACVDIEDEPINEVMAYSQLA